MGVNGKLHDIYTPDGLNMLGNIIEGNVDSCNPNFYGSIDTLARKILGYNLEPSTSYQIIPSALEMHSSSMRDPAFYRLYQRIFDFYYNRYEALRERTGFSAIFTRSRLSRFTPPSCASRIFLSSFGSEFSPAVNKRVNIRSRVINNFRLSTFMIYIVDFTTRSYQQDLINKINNNCILISYILAITFVSLRAGSDPSGITSH